jgi:hypothetical protein
MSAEQLIYPRGRIALANGDLVDCTNVKIDHTNNSKQVHTILKKGAGITQGNEETTVTFDLVISENGPERDWISYLKKGLIKQLRLKLPGLTLTVNGVVKQSAIDMPLDDAIKQSVTFIGHTSD